MHIAHLLQLTFSLYGIVQSQAHQRRHSHKLRQGQLEKRDSHFNSSGGTSAHTFLDGLSKILTGDDNQQDGDTGASSSSTTTSSGSTKQHSESATSIDSTTRREPTTTSKSIHSESLHTSGGTSRTASSDGNKVTGTTTQNPATSQAGLLQPVLNAITSPVLQTSTSGAESKSTQPPSSSSGTTLQSATSLGTSATRSIIPTAGTSKTTPSDTDTAGLNLHSLLSLAETSKTAPASSPQSRLSLTTSPPSQQSPSFTGTSSPSTPLLLTPTLFTTGSASNTGTTESKETAAASLRPAIAPDSLIQTMRTTLSNDDDSSNTSSSQSTTDSTLKSQVLTLLTQSLGTTPPATLTNEPGTSIPTIDPLTSTSSDSQTGTGQSSSSSTVPKSITPAAAFAATTTGTPSALSSETTTPSSSESSNLSSSSTTGASDTQTSTGASASNTGTTSSTQTGTSADESSTDANLTSTSQTSPSQTTLSTQKSTFVSFTSTTDGTTEPTMLLPSTMLTQPPVSTTTKQTPPVNTQQTLPAAIAPATGLNLPSGTQQLVQIGFNASLNYPFVVSNGMATQQIFNYLPASFAYATGMDPKLFVSNSLRPYDKPKYTATVAYLMIPQKNSLQLQALWADRNSKFYNQADESLDSLVQLIDRSIPFFIDANQQSTPNQGGSGGTINTEGTDSSATGSLADTLSLGSFTRNTTLKVVGIGVGAAVATALYASAMFLIARRYRRLRRPLASPIRGSFVPSSRVVPSMRGRDSLRSIPISGPMYSQNTLGI